jgi:SAM-dependent methyltransferase
MDPVRQRYLKFYWERQLDLIDAMIAPYKRPGAVLLDVGCGIGRNARRFAAGMSRYIGLNIDREELEVARRNHPEPEFEFREGDAMDMRAIPDSSVDVILLIFVLEHIASPDRLFGEIARTLKPGGGVLFLAPNLLNATSILIKTIPATMRLRIKQLLTGKAEPPDYPIYYRCNTVGQMDRMGERFGLTRDRLVMATSLGYFFRFPGFYRWHRLTEATSSLWGLRRFREFIFVTYRKAR